MQHDAIDCSQLLRDFVQGRDVPCPACGYNLRNTTSGRCPECGAVLQLRVNTPRVRAGAWVIAMLAAALPLGFDLTMLGVAGYAIYARLRAQSQAQFQPYSALTSADHKIIGLLAAAGVVYAILLLIAMRARQFLALRQPAARGAMVLTWTVFLLAGHVWSLNWIFRVLDSIW